MTSWWKGSKEKGPIRKKGERRVKQVAVDSSGNVIEVLTVKRAADYLGITASELKLQLFNKRQLNYYKVFTKRGSRVIRIKKKDLNDFKLDTAMFNRIADRIRQARKEHVYLKTGLSQADLAKSICMEREHLNRIERKKIRVSINALKKIGSALDKPMEYFLD